jgi:hypothetical protein
MEEGAMSFLKELRDAARVESNEVVRWKLNMLADTLQQAIQQLAVEPTQTTMEAVNGLWAHAARALSAHKPIGDNTSRGAGLREGARLAA